MQRFPSELSAGLGQPVVYDEALPTSFRIRFPYCYWTFPIDVLVAMYFDN